jgi:hypothetical protein
MAALENTRTWLIVNSGVKNFCRFSSETIPSKKQGFFTRITYYKLTPLADREVPSIYRLAFRHLFLYMSGDAIVARISSFGLMIILLCGCGKGRQINRVELVDSFANSNRLTIVLSRLNGIEKTPSCSESRHTEFDHHDFFGIECLLSEGIPGPTTVRLLASYGALNHDRFYATYKSDMFLRLHSEGREMILEIVGERDQTNVIRWNFDRAILPKGGFVFNRSRTIAGISQAERVTLYETGSLKSVAEFRFNPDVIKEPIARAYLSDDGESLFVQWDDSKAGISVLDRTGSERPLALSGNGWLADAEQTAKGPVFLFKDVVSKTTKLVMQDGNVSKEINCLDGFAWSYTAESIYFFGEPTQASVSWLRWQYSENKTNSGVFHLKDPVGEH